MSKSKLILPPSGLAIPKSAAPEPPPAVDHDSPEALIDMAGRGVFQALRELEKARDLDEDGSLLQVMATLTYVQAYLSEAQRELIGDLGGL